MGFLDVFKDQSQPKRNSPRSRQERIDDEIRRAKLHAGRKVLRDAEAEAERDPVKGRLKVAGIKEARLLLSQGDETSAAAALQKSMGKRWGNKLRTATRTRVTRTRKKSVEALERDAKAAAERLKAAKAKAK